MRYAGGYNVPGAAGNLAMGIVSNYMQPQLAQGLPFGEQGPAQGPNTPIRKYDGMGYGPYGPGGGGLPPTPVPTELAEMPRFIRGNYAPRGAIIKAPHLDSPYIDEQLRRGWVPMTPPVRSPGPQLPGFV